MKKRTGAPLLTLSGMSFRTLIEVLGRDGNQIDQRYLGRLAMLLGLGLVNSVLGRIEKYHNRSKIQAMRISEPPLFIIGYFRSGTTYLQNLLSLDGTNITPNAYLCLFPNHFHYSKKNGIRIFNWLTPRKRPMDEVRFNANVPFEDEFALATLSSVSPYFRFLFPNSDDDCMALDPRCLPDEALERWKEAMCYLMKSISFWKGQRRILLKSPLHAGRVETLLGLFPGAKFIHIVRNPYHVYQSNKKLWEETLCRSHLQVPDLGRVEEIMLSWYTELFSLLERDRHLIPEGSLLEIKFEDLEKNPVDSLKGIYEHFGFPGFAGFERKVSEYLESIEDYKKNSYQLDPVARQKVSSRWQDTFERYGYTL